MMWRGISPVILILLAISGSSHGQGRRRQNFNEVQSGPPESKNLNDRRNIGTEFPYRRGETPIFNFDQGDEVFLDTIPQLVKGLHQMAQVVGEQRKLTQAFGEAFAQCESCV